MVKTKKDNIRKGIDIIHWPRIRLFKDKKGDFHLAGEPDGLVELVEGVRHIHNRWKNRLSIGLESGSISPGRHPARKLGLIKMYETLHITYSYTAKNKSYPEFITNGSSCRIILTPSTLPTFFLEVYNAYQGWGDFEIEVIDKSSGKSVQCWLYFWGYANPHGVNTF